MPNDFRDGKTFPRRGRQPLGSFLWLARVIDKARASHAGTIHDYIYPCPMDKGMFQRWRISVRDFDKAVREQPDDQSILEWAQSRISSEACEGANAWLLNEKRQSLDRQDKEEAVG